MNTISKIKNLSLTKLNNAEFTNFMTRTQGMINAASAEALGVDESTLTRYNELLQIMNELVALSRTCNDTASMQAIDQIRNVAGNHLLQAVLKECNSPIEERSEAGILLRNLLKPYIGFYRLPMQQKTATLTGLLLDVSKEEYAAHIQTLGLSDIVAKLSQANAQYAILTEKRTAWRETNTQHKTLEVRREMAALYDILVSTGFAKNLMTPTEDTANFISSMNALITEVNIAYKQRRAQAKRYADSQKEETGEKEETENLNTVSQD